MKEHYHHELPQATWTHWIPVALIVLVSLLYLYLYFRCLRKGGRSTFLQVGSFLMGTLLLTIALWPSVMNWGHSDLRGHTVQHLLIAMYAPIFLVMGSPVTVVLKAAPPAWSRKFLQLMKSPFFKFLGHPFTAFILNIGGMFVLYLTPLYVRSLEDPVIHYLIHVHFLLAGYLFTWSLIGPDPGPKRPGFYTRLLVIFLSIATHGFLSKLMYAHEYPRNSPHPVSQIQQAAKMMYYWGDLSEIILLIILFTYWYFNKGRPQQNLSIIRKKTNYTK